MTAGSRLLAISDLHVAYPQNRELVASLGTDSPADWLIVAGDVAERVADVAWALELLAERFAQVIWAPGNHELWTNPREMMALRGAERYAKLVEVCRGLGVVTPEDPYPVWPGPEGGVVVAPLFLMYDYSFWPPGARSAQEALALAYRSGVICTDELVLHHDPYDSRAAWCEERIRVTEQRLAALAPGVPVVLVNHYPLVREPLQLLRFPEFGLWCGTQRTADWHRRVNAVAVVYGHLHIRRTTWHDGVPFMEVSVGYPREWSARGGPPGPCQVLPRAAA
jgi:3',5'-cyclic AMP phosphodiesterase CpdA